MNTAVDILSEFRDLVVQEKNVGLRDEALRDKPSFARLMTPYPKADFHKKWSVFEDKNRWSVVLAPRGSAKTLQLTVNDTCEEHLKDRNLRRLIVSETEFMSARMMRFIQETLTSERVRSVFGNVRGPKWTLKEITLADRTTAHKEASITALSYGGSIVSGRYDVIDMDDIATEETSRTQLQRDKMKEWLRFTLLPTLAPGGRVNVRGTRYHFDDIYQFMIDELKYQAMITPALDKEGRSYWPQLYSQEELDLIRKTWGPVAWGAQMMNNVDAMKGSIFRADWIKRYKSLPSGLRKYQGNDLAIGDKELDSYFAEVTIGEDPKSKAIYIIGEFKDRLSFKGQAQKIQANYEYYDKPTSPVMAIGIEANQYQAALAKHLKLETRLPIKAVHHHKDKVTRALRIQPHFENGKIFFPMEGAEMLEEQLLRFGPDMQDAKNIDVLDAFMTAMEIAGYGGRRKARVVRKPWGL